MRLVRRRGEVATETALTRSDGSFEWKHVRPDCYTLSVTGTDISPARISLVVPDTGLNVGVVTVPGTGRIAGRVFQRDEPGRPWAFAKGHVSFPNPQPGHHRESEIPFTADEQGRFAIENVPAGQVTVGFRYPITVDMSGLLRDQPSCWKDGAPRSAFSTAPSNGIFRWRS